VTVPALALTFDNLGEAADLERGHEPAGPHPSVTVLPWLLDALDERGLRATFFVEAINAEQHPEAVRAIADRGHEVGCHAWRHERWDTLGPEEEARTLTRSVAALRELGLDVRGFRPPGGELNAGTPQLLRAHGLDWCSPHGSVAHRRPDGLAVLPFAWPLVDAYHRLAHFADLRAAHGDPRAPLDAAATAARLEAELARAASPACLVLHPFLAADPDGAAALRRILDIVAGLDAEAGPGGPIAAALVQ
jgi:peptidoglycan/xylan/chitin deacetylase (PgdA/CDA1 family)